MPDPVIVTESLSKSYGDLQAVRDLNLHVDRGEVVGLLGPNGAGKTTTLLMILGILPPTKGELRMFGSLSATDFGSKRRIGVVPESQYFYEDMNPREFLSLFAEIYDISGETNRIGRVLEEAELSEWAETRIGGFSHGMKQRLSIARALLHDPDLLVLDEPVLGLDPYGVRDVRRMIQRQQELGKTIVISSHVLSEVEKSATRVGILRKGQLIAEESVSSLRRRASGSTVVELTLQSPTERVLAGIRALECVGKLGRDGRVLRINTDGTEEALSTISQRVSSLGGVVLGMRTTQATLEQAFFTITDGNVGEVVGDLQ